MGKRITGIAVLLQVIAAIVLVAGVGPCMAGGDQIRRLRVTEVFRKYDHTPEGKVNPLILTITFTDTLGRLMESASVKLRVKDKETPFEPLHPGVFVIELDRVQRRKGGMLEMKVEDYWGLIETHIRSNAVPEHAAGPMSPEILSTEKMSTVRGDTQGIAVYHGEPGELDRARLCLEFLERVFPELSASLGLEPVKPFAVVLTPLEEPVVMTEEGRWPYAYNRESFEEFKVAVLRAWVETTIGRSVNFNTDRRNRWVAEGIKSLATLQVLAALGEDAVLVRWLEELVPVVPDAGATPRPVYNLSSFAWPQARGFVEDCSLERGMGVEPGVSVSLAFFLKLHRRHGDEFIHRFIVSAGSMREGIRTNPGLINVIEAISGEKYKLEVRSFSLLEAREFLVKELEAARARLAR